VMSALYCRKIKTSNPLPELTDRLVGKKLKLIEIYGTDDIAEI
jgi:uncharacterized membrane protein HdeD (DUF308 family)